MDDALPVLPEPSKLMPPHSRHWVGFVEAFNADQMFAYARAAVAADRAATASLLAEAAALLSRAPKATRDMYVGRDSVSFGHQAEALAKRIRAAAPTPKEGQTL